MRPGRLRDWLVFEARVVTVSGGQSLISWSALAADGAFSVPGEAQRTGEMSCRFIIRYKSGVTKISHRLLWDDCIWMPASVVHDEKRTMLTIDCDFGELVEVTHLQSTETEYIDGVPVVRPPE